MEIPQSSLILKKINMNWITVIGYCAAFMTTVGFFPQFLKTVKTKKTKDISLWMYVILITGIILWLVYGI